MDIIDRLDNSEMCMDAIDDAIREIKILRTAIAATIAKARNQGCRHVGCDDEQHSSACPLGLISSLREAFKATAVTY